MTCIIGDVDTAVAVSWKDKDGSLITDSQDGYTIKQGNVEDSTKEQKATLTISTKVLSTLGSPVTFTCAANSKQFPDSEVSTDQNVVLTLLTLGKILRQQV